MSSSQLPPPHTWRKLLGISALRIWLSGWHWSCKAVAWDSIHYSIQPHPVKHLHLALGENLSGIGLIIRWLAGCHRWWWYDSSCCQLLPYNSIQVSLKSQHDYSSVKVNWQLHFIFLQQWQGKNTTNATNAKPEILFSLYRNLPVWRQSSCSLCSALSKSCESTQMNVS